MKHVTFSEYQEAKNEILFGVEFKESSSLEGDTIRKTYATEKNGVFYEVNTAGRVEFWSDKHPESRIYDENATAETTTQDAERNGGNEMTTKTKKETSVHVTFSYSASHSAGFRIFKEETIIFPCYTPEEDAAALKYLGQMMKKTREFAVYVVRLENTGKKNRDGADVYEKTNCKMFQRGILNESVCEIMCWGGERYELEQHYADVKTALKELEQEIDIQKNWIDL